MPQDFDGSWSFYGAICFGIVMGWITYRTLRRYQTSGLTDIATVIGALGGAAITGIWKPGTGAFGGYCIGLAAGFFAYLIVSVIIAGSEGRAKVGEWLGAEPPPNYRGERSGNTSPVHSPPRE